LRFKDMCDNVPLVVKLSIGGITLSRKMHTETDRAIWLIHCISSTAEDLSLSVSDTVRLLDEYGLVKPLLDGYRAFHTQGYEYIAEMLVDELHKAQGVLT